MFGGFLYWTQWCILLFQWHLPFCWIDSTNCYITFDGCVRYCAHIAVASCSTTAKLFFLHLVLFPPHLHSVPPHGIYNLPVQLTWWCHQYWWQHWFSFCQLTPLLLNSF
jgi:hypothetical protein